MAIYGLPDVSVPVAPEDAWSRSRAHEAVLYACDQMARSNAPLVVGTALEVPLRCRIGAWPYEPRPGAVAGTGYRISANHDERVLLPTALNDWATLWQRDPSSTPVSAYQALFDRGLGCRNPGRIERELPSRSPEVPPHVVTIRSRDDGRGFLMVTNGFGLRAKSDRLTGAPAFRRYYLFT
jgi:hypothetical protein